MKMTSSSEIGEGLGLWVIPLGICWIGIGIVRISGKCLLFIAGYDEDRPNKRPPPSY
jgi:hypothetical protein